MLELGGLSISKDDSPDHLVKGKFIGGFAHSSLFVFSTYVDDLMVNCRTAGAPLLGVCMLLGD